MKITDLLNKRKNIKEDLQFEPIDDPTGGVINTGELTDQSISDYNNLPIPSQDVEPVESDEPASDLPEHSTDVSAWATNVLGLNPNEFQVTDGAVVLEPSVCGLTIQGCDCEVFPAEIDDSQCSLLGVTVRDCPNLVSLTGFPKFNNATRPHINIINCPKLHSLEGLPQSAEVVYLSNLGIEDFSGAPQQVGKFFSVDNPVSSFCGHPQVCQSSVLDGGDVSALHGLPDEIGSLHIHNSPNLFSLHGVPRKIHGEFHLFGSPDMDFTNCGEHFDKIGALHTDSEWVNGLADAYEVNEIGGVIKH